MTECERLGVHAITYDGTALCCVKFTRVAALLGESRGTIGEPDKRANAHPALTPQSTHPRAGL